MGRPGTAPSGFRAPHSLCQCRAGWKQSREQNVPAVEFPSTWTRPAGDPGTDRRGHFRIFSGKDKERNKSNRRPEARASTADSGATGLELKLPRKPQAREPPGTGSVGWQVAPQTVPVPVVSSPRLPLARGPLFFPHSSVDTPAGIMEIFLVLRTQQSFTQFECMKV